MNAKTWTKKLVGTGVLGVMLAAAGMTAALAATPAATTDPAGAYQLSEVTNLTPYTWTLLPNTTTGSYDMAPPQTVAPGQTATWAAQGITLENWAWTYYSFTDSAGNPHTVEVFDRSNGYDNAHHWVESFSKDGSGPNAPESTASFHMAIDPDGAARHVDAVWNSPTAISIDGAKDPAAAAVVVNSQLPRVAASAITFTPNGQPATWSDDTTRRVSSMVINNSSAQVTVGTQHSTAVGQSTSISEDTTVSLSTKIFGAAASAAATYTQGQSWSTTDGVAVNRQTGVDPGMTGWLALSSSTASLTGDLKFTTPDNITYTITDVQVSRGDLVSPNSTIPGGTNIHRVEVANGTATTATAH